MQLYLFGSHGTDSGRNIIDNLKVFFDALNNEESKLIPVLASDNLGLLMRCAINELDWCYYNHSRTPKPTEEQQEQLYIMQVGTTRLIKLVLENRKSFDVPVVTMRRRTDWTMKVLSMVSALGIIQHGRRVAQTIASGIGKIEKTGPNVFTIKLPHEIEDDDFYEQRVLEHYNNESRYNFRSLFAHKKFQKLEKKVYEKLYELVYPFMEYHIGYGADPLLDTYFFGLASHEVSLHEGYDTYHYAVKFGGISVQHYMLALTYLISDSIRHERFAEALVKKAPEVKLENVLTISADVDPFVESLRDAVNYFGSEDKEFEEIDLVQAKQIFNVLTYGRDTLNLIDAPGSPYPLSVRCSETGVIRALFGARSEPVRYLLESLRFHFPKDYDRNQIGREASLQRAIRRVLNEAFQDLDYLQNVKMRLNERVLSDIDLIILDKKNATVLLFQLKHQELYGSDLHSKFVRNKRLRDQVTDWVHAVDTWISKLGLEGVKKNLQLKEGWPQDFKIFQIVICRHFAHSLKGIVIGENSAYANWPQLFNSIQIVKKEYKHPTLENLINVLQKTPDIVTHLPEPTTKWNIDELTFITTTEE